MAVTRQQVAELYVATFNRAPDAAGLDYWVNDSGLTIEGIAQSFFDQPETQTLYPAGTTNTAFVTAIYSNLFNRTPDAAGLAYWVAELNNATMTRSVMIEAMKNGVLGTDATIIANKATVGLYYADTLGLDGTTFSLSTVTADAATVTAAQAAADALNVGTTYALTNSYNQTTGGIDFITATAKNDLFIGSVDGTQNTYGIGDIIDGGAGKDTLNLSISADSDSVTVSNVENVLVRNTNTLVKEFDATSISGASNITSYKSKGDLKITGVQTLDTKIGIDGTDQDVFVGFATTATAGSADAITVELNAVGTSAPANVNFYTENIETINLVSNGTSKNYLGAVGSDADSNIANFASASSKLTKLVITGAAELRLDTALDNSVKDVDGSAATGNIRLTMGTNVSNVKTGSGNDRINMGVAANITADDTVDGGAGTDAIVIADGFSTATTKITNIEQIRTADGGALSNTQNTDTYNMTTIASVDEVIIASSHIHRNAANNANVQDHVAVTNGEGKLTSVIDFVGNVTYTDKTNKASMTLKLDNGEKSTKDDGVDLTGTVTLDSVETLTINSVGASMLLADSDNTRTGLHANSVTIADATQIATINITGDADVEVTATAEVGAKTFNASTHTGNVSLTVDNTTDKTITMGAGKDYVNLGTDGTGNAKNTVDLGAGDDSLVMAFADLATTDSLKGGDGTDTLVIAGSMDVGDLTKSAVLGAVSSFEKISMSNNTTLTLSDAAISSLGGSSVAVTRAATGAAASTVLGVQGANGDGGGTFETATVVLTALAAGGTVTVAGITIQAVTALTATQVGDAYVAAFAGNSSTVSYLVSGTKATPTNWGAAYTVVNGAGTLTFTNATDANIATTVTDFNATINNDGVAILANSVTQANTTITTDGSKVTDSDAVLIYTGSNAIDAFTGTLGNDTVSINASVLKATDTFVGGAGNDTFILTVSNTGTTLVSEAAADLVGVKSFNTILIDDDGTNTAKKIGIVVDNTFVDNNSSSNTLTIKAAYDSNSLTTIDASGVTNDVTLNLMGGTAADTLKGGAGDDEINGLIGNDTLTGGAGKDDFNFTSTGAANLDAITDIDFGTNSGTANVDQIDISGLAASMGGGAFTFAASFDSIQKDSAAATAATTVDVIIMDTQTYADATAAETAMTAQVAVSNNDIIVIWADSFNVVHVSIDDDRDTNTGTGLLDIATLTGATLSGVYAALDTADFIIA